MKNTIDSRKLRPACSFDKDNEIAMSLQKLNEMIENLNVKVKESMSNQERSFLASFNKVIALIQKDIKILKENYSEALQKLEINSNIIQLKKEVFLLKNQIGGMGDENRLLRKIIADYRGNVTNIQSDRNFEKSFVMETQRENKYLKITLDEMIKENDKKQENSRRSSKNAGSFRYQDQKSFEENVSSLMTEDRTEEEKITIITKMFESMKKQKESEIIDYKNEIKSLRSKLWALTQTNGKIFSKINGISKIEKLFEDSIEEVKKKIFARRERSKSTGQTALLPNSFTNSNVSQLEEITTAVDVDDFNKLDRMDLMFAFFSNENFISIIRDLATRKKCCAHSDCYFNAENTKNNESNFDSMCFPDIIKKLRPKSMNQLSILCKNEPKYRHTERSYLQTTKLKENNDSVLTNRDVGQKQNEKQRIEQQKENIKMNENKINVRVNVAKSDDKLQVFFRKRNLRKNFGLTQKSQDFSNLSYIGKEAKIEDVKNKEEISFSH